MSNDYRKKGIASRLVANCLAKLKEDGVSKCHLFVFANNQHGMSFWNRIGFHKRNDINIFSRYIDEFISKEAGLHLLSSNGERRRSIANCQYMRREREGRRDGRKEREA